MTTKFLLLLGAGFSRNWGGWLASEVNEYLLSRPELSPIARGLLLQNLRKGGFETALGELQSNSSLRQELNSFHAALQAMYGDMNKAFESKKFEFSNSMDRLVKHFLTKFDAIFTLNQDLLLERHYLSQFPLGSVKQWSGGGSPGVPSLTSITTDIIIPTENRNFQTESNFQPYFKLHGSSNWRTNNGKDLLVAGARKQQAIQMFPILEWYHNEFQRYLRVSVTRLMIIGYSFGDEHINRVIMDAVQNHTVQLFIIDPLGVDVANEYRNNPTSPYTGAFEQMWKCTVGASRRSLAEIFSSDDVEFQKVMRFFV